MPFFSCACNYCKYEDFRGGGVIAVIRRTIKIYYINIEYYYIHNITIGRPITSVIGASFQ